MTPGSQPRSSWRSFATTMPGAPARDGLRSMGAPPSTSAGLWLRDGAARAGEAQRRANDRLWRRTDLVKAYANRELRPVEVMLLLRYTEALSGVVMELGCGAGRFTGYLAEVAKEAHGVDI